MAANSNIEIQTGSKDYEPDDKFKGLVGEGDLYGALEYIMSLVRAANKYIEENKPWELAKNDESKFDKVMQKLFSDLSAISNLLVPFLPETSEKIKKALETKKTEILFNRIK